MDIYASIGVRLREERERVCLSQSDVAEIAKNAGVPGATRQSQSLYEKGKRMPDAAYLAAVEQAGIDVLYVLAGRRMYGEIPAHPLTPDERELLALYRAASPTGRAAAVGALHGVIGKSDAKRGGFNMTFHGSVGQQTNVDGDATVNVSSKRRGK